MKPKAHTTYCSDCAWRVSYIEGFAVYPFNQIGMKLHAQHCHNAPELELLFV